MYGAYPSMMMTGLGYGAYGMGSMMNPMMMGMGMPGFGGIGMGGMFGGLNNMMGYNQGQDQSQGSGAGGILSGLMNALGSFANVAMYRYQSNMMTAQQEALFKQTWGSTGATRV